MKKYELSIGLNDRVSKKQEIPTETAKNIIIKTCNENGADGLTLINTLGVFTHDDGVTITENGFLLVLMFITKKQVKQIRKDLIEKLNQADIYINEYKFKSIKAKSVKA